MIQIICDKCREPIAGTYYTLIGHYTMLGDSKIDVCEKCASLHSIDGQLIVGKELIFMGSEEQNDSRRFNSESDKRDMYEARKEIS